MARLFSKIGDYFSFVTFTHTIFALPFAIIGFFLATTIHAYPFNWGIFIKILLAMVFARNTAMGFNRYLDRKIDNANPRTVNREIPSGIISPRAGLLFTLINAAAFIATTATINMLVLFLSPVSLLVIMGYSYTKRFTAFCHLILGLGLSIAPIGAYLAVTGKFHILPLIFSFVVLSWVSGFDIIYAMQDREFDQKNNLHSIPVKTGKKTALIISSILHLLTAILVLYAGIMAGFGWFYFIGAGLFIALLVYQHLLVKPNDLSRVNRAFGTTNGVASVIFAVFFLLEVLL
ncbi:MAG: UbiA family prenyltransferase [Bacteroidales bacterium]|nr:UbiA family prenyltransferase [Bacteroidales bacterium]